MAIPRTRLIAALLTAALAVLAAACGSSESSARTPTPPSPPTAAPTATSAPGSLSPPRVVSPPGAATPPCGRVYGSPPLAFAGPSHVWFGDGSPTAGRGWQVLASQDGGATWAPYRAPVAPEVMQFIDARHGWIAGRNEPESFPNPCTASVAATSDGGATWTQLTTFAGRRIVQIAFVSSEDGWVLLDNCDPQCFQGAPELFATLDAGASWHAVALPDATDPLALQRADASHAWVLAGNELFITSDSGSTWTAVPEPCGSDELYPMSDRLGVLDFVDDNHGWVGCTSGNAGGGMAPKALHGTTDGGHTWRILSGTPFGAPTPDAGVGELPGGGAISSLYFLDARNGWLATGGPESFVYQTADAGRTWTASADGTGGGIANIAFADANDGWAWGTVLLHTTDGGGHWSQLQVP